VVVIVATVGIAYSGLYDVAADVPHTRPVWWFMQIARQRSIARYARAVKVPVRLITAQRVEAGAGLYADMCSRCHLAPGMAKTEISQGLYPPAPELAKGTALTPAEEFWVIKHGIKMSGMAAWGKTHSDQLIWDMVAFLRRLPQLSPAVYAQMVKNAPAEHHMLMKMQSLHRQ
jgi:mono/diheme cytochrome c family protein